MAADDIARVVKEVRHDLGLSARAFAKEKNPVVIEFLRTGPVIDTSALYDKLPFTEEYIVEEKFTELCPPWPFFTVAFENRYKNVYVMETAALKAPFKEGDKWISEVPETRVVQAIDWDNVEWIMDSFVYIGGQSTTNGRPIQTQGPMHLWQTALDKSGIIVDCHWVKINEDLDVDAWRMSRDMLYTALQFLNCRNVEIVVPKRHRHVQRRIQRTGLEISHIVVKPFGKSYRSKGTNDELQTTIPLTHVRGHFAEYGPTYNKGKLFGKLEGRYWIPGHVRGDAEHGEREHNYILRPNDE